MFNGVLVVAFMFDISRSSSHRILRQSFMIDIQSIKFSSFVAMSLTSPYLSLESFLIASLARRNVITVIKIRIFNNNKTQENAVTFCYSAIAIFGRN